MYSIGCDLHSKRMQLCLVDDDPDHEGYPLPEPAVLLEENVEATRGALAAWMGEADRVAPGPKALAVETTSNWEWFVDAAALLVEEVHLVHAQKAKAIASARIKTDKIDARVLAWLVKNDLVPDVFIPPPEARELREVFRHRSYLIKERTAFKNRVHSLLKKRGIRNRHSDLFGVGGREFLADLELAEPHERVLADSLEVIDGLTEKIEGVDRYLDTHPQRPSEMVRRLKTTPGLGQRLSMHAALEIVDIDRFVGDRNYVSYCGLAPGTHESDGTSHRRGLLPHGNRYLKWIYTHGAGHAKRHSYFRATHRRQERKNGKMIARLTVARKMARANYHMLTKGEDFLGGA